MTEDKKIGIIPSIFKAFDKENIPYVVLRNYDTLPEKPGNDIDIFIDQSAKRICLRILKEIAQNNCVSILKEIHHFNCSTYFIYQIKPIRLRIVFDFITLIATKEGFIWVDGNLLLKERIHHEKGFYIPSPGMEAAILFLKDILDGSPVKEKYRLKIQRLIKNDETNFIRAISPYWNEEILQQMIRICLNGKWEDAFNNRRQWKLSLVLNALKHEPVKQIFRSLNFLLGHLNERICFRNGIFIAVVGPDGSGKSTICQNLQKRTITSLFKKIYCYHGHFGFFPELATIYNYFFLRRKSRIDNNTVSASAKLGLPRAFLHIIYYGLECFLSWPWVVLAKIRGNLLIFDRYFYDFAATDTHRKLPLSFFLMIAKVIPHPDILFVVDARPEEIFKRKPELSVDEIKNQLTVFQGAWLSKLTRCVIVDTEKSIEDTLDKIEDEILKILK